MALLLIIKIEITYGSKSCVDLRARLLLAPGSPTNTGNFGITHFTIIFFITKSIIVRLRFFLKLFSDWFAYCKYLMVHNFVCLSFRRRHQEFLLQFHRKWEVLVAFISTIVFHVSRQKLHWIKTRGRICSRPL